MTDHFSHLYALEDSLDRETARRDAAKPGSNEFKYREHCIAMKLKEIANEKAFLRARGIEVVEVENLSDDELLAELLK